MRPPTNNPVTQGKHGTYNAVDYDDQPDADFYAPEAGTVVSYAYNGTCGNNLQVQGANGRHGFCHLEKSYVAVGAKVKKGQRIGRMGYTGYTIPDDVLAGTHLHWVLRLANGTYVYPPSKITEPFGGSSTKPAPPAQGGSKVTKAEATSMLTAVADKLFGKPFDSKGLAHYVGLVTGGTYTPGKAISEIFDGTQAQNHLKGKYGKTVTKTVEKVVRDPKDIERIKELEADLAEAKTQNTPPAVDLKWHEHLVQAIKKLIPLVKEK